jgi:hypothetical protein
MNGLSTKAKIAIAALIAAAFGFVLGTFLISLPMPKIESLTKTEIGLAIRGRTRPNVAVLAFAKDGSVHSVTRADENGQFNFGAISPEEGETEFFLRAVNLGWRASPRVRVTIADAKETVTTSASSTATTEEDDELPPLGIPPTSTKPKVEEEEATSTEDGTGEEEEIVIESLSAVASVASASLSPKETQTVTITIKDQDNLPFSDATINVVAHYPTEDTTYSATGSKGTYRVRFKVPENIGAGTNVLLDVTASYKDLTSTARASFSIE